MPLAVILRAVASKRDARKPCGASCHAVQEEGAACVIGQRESALCQPYPMFEQRQLCTPLRTACMHAHTRRSQVFRPEIERIDAKASDLRKDLTDVDVNLCKLKVCIGKLSRAGWL
eukprot:363353-Chlamydomonas_euryale.AAC.2